MDNYRFGSAYGELPEKNPPSNPERREILEAPRKWMRFFSETMHDYLLDEEPPLEDRFLEQLSEYYLWNQRFLGPLMARTKEIDEPSLMLNDTSSEFVFHQLNGPLTFMWYQLLYSDTENYDAKSLSDIQAHLAVTMTPSVQRLKKLQDSRLKTDDTREFLSLQGITSELDSLVTLLELQKQHPQLVVLPSP